MSSEPPPDRPTTQFVAALKVLQEGVGKPIPHSTVVVWWRVLKDLPIEDVQRAVVRYLATSEFPGLPAIGKIRSMAIESVHGIAESPEEAFERVRMAVSSHGYSQSSRARDELGDSLWSVIEGIGGWDRICSSPVLDRSSLFAQFRDAWLRRVQREREILKIPTAERPKLAREKTEKVVENLSKSFALDGPVD